MSASDYRRRTVDATIERLLSQLPAVMVTGPRAAGKTTTAARHTSSLVRLDRPREAEAFRFDPDVALGEYDEPILLDEWQEVPSVLGAIKRAVDADPRPGRFVLTGSVRADLEAATWPGTGRVVRVPMYGMTVRELNQGVDEPSLFDRISAGTELPVPEDPPDLRGYIELALRSGFPDPALLLTPDARARWLEGYVDQLLTRDVAHIAAGRDPARLRRYFEAYALNTAGIATDSTLLRAAGINRRTAVAYEQLLVNLFVVEAMPAWSSNRLRRLSRGAKRYFIDAALPPATLGLDASAVLRDGDLIGRLLDTFVAAQLRAETTDRTRPRLYHVREEHGRREIDIVAEIDGRNVLAIEVKADAAPGRDAARHLAWLRDRLGDRFLAGLVLHTGPRPFHMDEKIVAAPICALWG